MTTHARRNAKLGLVVLVAAALGLAYRFGFFEQVAEPRTLARSVQAMGAPWYCCG